MAPPQHKRWTNVAGGLLPTVVPLKREDVRYLGRTQGKYKLERR
jgi:hypothetical protein